VYCPVEIMNLLIDFLFFVSNRKGLLGIAEEKEMLPYEKWLWHLYNRRADLGSTHSQGTCCLPKAPSHWISSFDNVSESSLGSPHQI